MNFTRDYGQPGERLVLLYAKCAFTHAHARNVSIDEADAEDFAYWIIYGKDPARPADRSRRLSGLQGSRKDGQKAVESNAVGGYMRNPKSRLAACKDLGGRFGDWLKGRPTYRRVAEAGESSDEEEGIVEARHELTDSEPDPSVLAAFDLRRDEELRKWQDLQEKALGSLNVEDRAWIERCTAWVYSQKSQKNAAS